MAARGWKVRRRTASCIKFSPRGLQRRAAQLQTASRSFKHSSASRAESQFGGQRQTLASCISRRASGADRSQNARTAIYREELQSYRHGLDIHVCSTRVSPSLFAQRKSKRERKVGVSACQLRGPVTTCAKRLTLDHPSSSSSRRAGSCDRWLRDRSCRSSK